MRNKLNRSAEQGNRRLVEDLCTWIESNLEVTLGLQTLVEYTNFSSTDIQYLFERYKQTTPMTYIRNRLEEKENLKRLIISKERITPIFISKEDKKV